MTNKTLLSLNLRQVLIVPGLQSCRRMMIQATNQARQCLQSQLAEFSTRTDEAQPAMRLPARDKKTFYLPPTAGGIANRMTDKH